MEALAAFAPVLVTDIATLGAALDAIREIGAATDAAPQATALAAEIAAGFESLAAFPLRRAAYFIWKDPWMTVGGDTFIHDVLRRAGFANVFGDAARYPSVTPEAVAARAAGRAAVLVRAVPLSGEARRRDAGGVPGRGGGVCGR